LAQGRRLLPAPADLPGPRRLLSSVGREHALHVRLDETVAGVADPSVRLEGEAPGEARPHDDAFISRVRLEHRLQQRHLAALAIDGQDLISQAAGDAEALPFPEEASPQIDRGWREFGEDLIARIGEREGGGTQRPGLPQTTG